MNKSFKEVMGIRGEAMPSENDVTITGHDPVYPTPFKISETCASVLAGIGIAASDIWEIRTGKRQTVAVDTRHAAATLNSSLFMQAPDASGQFTTLVNKSHEAMLAMTQPWPTRDGRWFLPHFGLPNLKERVLKVLGCDANPESIGKAVAQRDALELENAIDEARACGAMVRSSEEWLSHTHGQVLRSKPIVEITKISDSDPEPFPTGDRPLSGIRTLDLTRILAGPIAARTLAEHGSDVLMVTAEHLPQIEEHVMDTSHGKRSSFIDLKTSEGRDQLSGLARDADVFSQGYRPGMLQGFGLGPEELAAVRPGIIYLSISCFGAGGPFSHRAGWEQVAQTVTGICHDGHADRPGLLPAAACDYTTGYLGAYGVMLALARRAREGGSYHVEVSLCQSGMFIHRQGKTDYSDQDIGLTDQELDEIRVNSKPAFGPLRHIGPVLKMSETQPHWLRPTPTLGADTPNWLDRAI